MFQFQVLTKRDWAFVAVITVLMVLAIGFSMNWLLVKYTTVGWVGAAPT